MQELIARLKTLLEEFGSYEEVRPGTKEASSLTSRDWTRYHGMQDLVLAMEDRMATLRSYSGPALPDDVVRLLEKA